jgi:hypothetical protein
MHELEILYSMSHQALLWGVFIADDSPTCRPKNPIIPPNCQHLEIFQGQYSNVTRPTICGGLQLDSTFRTKLCSWACSATHPFVIQAFDGFPFDFRSVEAWEPALLRPMFSSKAPSLLSPSVGFVGVPPAFALGLNFMWLRRSSLCLTCIPVGLEPTGRLSSATGEGGTPNNTVGRERGSQLREEMTTGVSLGRAKLHGASLVHMHHGKKYFS